MSAQGIVANPNANEVVALATAKAKRASAVGVDSSRRPLRSIDLIKDIAKALWPTKTASELAYRANVTQRQAENWLAGRYDLSADALTALLRSAEGLKILEGMIGSSKPVWWGDFKRNVRRGELRRRIDDLAKQLDRLEETDDA